MTRQATALAYPVKVVVEPKYVIVTKVTIVGESERVYYTGPYKSKERAEKTALKIDTGSKGAMSFVLPLVHPW